MLFKLFLLFTVIPFIELVILIKLSSLIGLVETILLVIITGFLGAYHVRAQGLIVIKNIQVSLQFGELPGDHLVDGLLLLIAGAVLITPGILTDVVGFSLLFPLVRANIKKFFKKYFESALKKGTVHYTLNNRRDN